MSSRYDNKKVLVNNTKEYVSVFKDRGVKYIKQYATPKFRFPTAEEIEDIQEIGVIWSVGDRLWKLAEKYYNNPEYWWVIAFWNQTNEMLIKNGQTVYVPMPLDKVLSIIEV